MATRISDETRARIEAIYGGLLDALAAGEEMAPSYEIAKVSADQVRVWRMEDKSGEREKQWQAAREQSADAYADRVSAIANNPGFDSGIARVKMDALRWLAAKRNPRAYSDKSSVDVNVRTVDLTKIIGDANARLAAAQAGRVLEGEVLRLALPDAAQHSGELLDLM